MGNSGGLEQWNVRNWSVSLLGWWVAELGWDFLDWCGETCGLTDRNSYMNTSAYKIFFYKNHWFFSHVVKVANFLLGNDLLAYSKVPWWNMDKNTACFFLPQSLFCLIWAWIVQGPYQSPPLQERKWFYSWFPYGIWQKSTISRHILSCIVRKFW